MGFSHRKNDRKHTWWLVLKIITRGLKYHSADLGLSIIMWYRKDKIVPEPLCFGWDFTALPQIWNEATFLVDVTHSCRHTCCFCSGLHAVSSWARVSGGDSPTGEDGPVEQNCVRLPGVLSLLTFFPPLNIFYYYLVVSNVAFWLLRSFRGLMTTLWYHTMSPLEQQGELCLRGTSAQHTSGFFFSFFLPAIFSSSLFYSAGLK